VSRLRVFENWVLRRILGPKRDEVAEEWRKLHNEELSNLYSSPNIVWLNKSRMSGRGMQHVWGREVYTGLWWGNLKGKRPLGRYRRRWEDNIKMDIQEVGCEVIYWTDLAQGRHRWRTLVNAVINLWIP
jgi:hypothetical protein